MTDSNYLIAFMGTYRTKLQTENIGQGRHKLLAPLIYRSETVGTIEVPAGFETDFASVPRLPFIYWIFGGMGDEEAVLHDWLYTPPHKTHEDCGRVVTRAEADCMFRGARYASAYKPMITYESVSLLAVLSNFWAYIGAWCMWAGVRCFGWRHWKK